jgi:hypothetical protein
MSKLLANPIWPACRSALALDRWLAGELNAADSEELRLHVESCARCQPVLQAMRDERNEPLPTLRAASSVQPFISLHSTINDLHNPQSSLPAVVDRVETSKRIKPRRSRWSRSFALATGLAAAAALLLVVRGNPAERSKGSGDFALGMYVQHGDSVRRAGVREEVQAGDALRFAISSQSDGYAAVLSLDPKGRASIYFPGSPPGSPSGDGRAAFVSAGADVALPLSTRLDDTVGEEQLLAIFCKTPVDLTPLRASLEHGQAEIPSGCQVAQQRFVKR